MPPPCSGWTAARRPGEPADMWSPIPQPGTSSSRSSGRCGSRRSRMRRCGASARIPPWWRSRPSTDARCGCSPPHCWRDAPDGDAMPRDDTSMRVSADPIRVLVVDDQRFMRIALRQIIEHDGDMRVVGEARTGVEAVAMARELKPDAVTMDIEMPEMDGLEACASIMREVTPKPAIIMVSAHTQAGAQGAIDALQRGAVDFVSKASVVAKTDLA